MKIKPGSIVSISSLLVSLALGTIACGSESLPTGAPDNTVPVVAGATAGVPSTGTVAPPASPRITTAAAITTIVPTAKIEPTATAKVANSIQNNWLKAIPCRAPCWENITPGKTTPEEALEFLKKNPGLSNVEVSDPKFGNKPVAIYWYTLYNAYKPEPSGFVSYHSQSVPPHIEMIKPLVLPYKLKDVFSLYGEPSHAIAGYLSRLDNQPERTRVSLIYLDQGLILSNTSTDIQNLTPDTTFSEIYFFIPGLQGFNIVDLQERLDGDTMVDWQGFKDFKFYCRRGDAKINGIKSCL